MSCLGCAGVGPIHLQISPGSKPQVDELALPGRCWERAEPSFRKLCVVLTEARGPDEVQQRGSGKKLHLPGTITRGEHDT